MSFILSLSAVFHKLSLVYEQRHTKVYLLIPKDKREKKNGFVDNKVSS